MLSPKQTKYLEEELCDNQINVTEALINKRLNKTPTASHFITWKIDHKDYQVPQYPKIQRLKREWAAAKEGDRVWKSHSWGKRSEDEARSQQYESRVVAEEGLGKCVPSKAKPHSIDQITDEPLRLHQNSHHSNCHNLERGIILNHKKPKLRRSFPRIKLFLNRQKVHTFQGL